MVTIRAPSPLRQGKGIRIGLNLNELGPQPYSRLGILAMEEMKSWNVRKVRAGGEPHRPIKSTT